MRIYFVLCSLMRNFVPRLASDFEQNHHHEAFSRKNFGTKIQFFHIITKEIHQKLPVTRSKPSVIKSKPLN